MAENYDNVCSICEDVLTGDAKYYCCPKCHRMHKERRHRDEDGHNDGDKQVSNEGAVASISDSRKTAEEPLHTDPEAKESCS